MCCIYIYIQGVTYRIDSSPMGGNDLAPYCMNDDCILLDTFDNG